MKINNSILIIGPPKSGKTTFQAQLYMRLQRRKGVIKLVRTPDNIEGLIKACDRLSAGKETEATPANENVEVIIPVSYKDKEFDLVCKDYGGEQVSNITELMEFDQHWQSRAKNNDRWILFIRPGEIYHHYDLSLKGYAEIDREREEKGKLHKVLSHQYQYIELLQALLHARGSGIKSSIKLPKLLIALTCWDELKTTETPESILQKKMPLFYQFVKTLWKDSKNQIVGLSAQGFSLDIEEHQTKYLEELPESFGHLILNDNPEFEEPDLTRLIEIALTL